MFQVSQWGQATSQVIQILLRDFKESSLIGSPEITLPKNQGNFLEVQEVGEEFQRAMVALFREHVVDFVVRIVTVFLDPFDWLELAEL